MTEYQSPWHVFVLAGQSNMAGRGGVHGLPGDGKAWDQEQPCLRSPGRSPNVIMDWHSPMTIILPQCAHKLCTTWTLLPADLEIRCWDASGQWRHAEEPMHADIDVG